MQTYWDLSEKQRAELTADDVRAYLDIELMQEGVLRPKPPILDVIEEQKIDLRRCYGVGGIDGHSKHEFDVLFETEQQAREFIDMKPLHREKDWNTDTEYAKAKPNLAIEPVDIATESQVMGLRSILVSNKEKKNRNEKLSREYNEAVDGARKTESRIWDDWNECRSIVTSHERVVSTFDEYKLHTANNTDMALTFLRKAFAQEQIDAAFAWFGVTP